MGQSGRPLGIAELLPIVRAMASVSTSGKHQSIAAIAARYGIALTTAKCISRQALSRAVAILERENRLQEILEGFQREH